MTEISKWLLGVVTSTAFLGFIAYITRTSISHFFTKSIEYKFEKKVEKFKSDIKNNENELEQIRSFLALTRRERDSILQLKRFEAAEVLIHLRQFLSGFMTLAEYSKYLKIDEIMKRGNDYKVAEFINDLIKPFKIDEKLTAYGEIDRTLTILYLDERSQKMFKIYESIIMNVVMTMKLLSIPLENKSNFINDNYLAEMITEVVPSSKEGFDKYGDNYAVYWLRYFYSEISKELRNELLGTTNTIKDTEAAAKLIIDSRRAQSDIIKSLQQHGLPSELFNPLPNPDEK